MKIGSSICQIVSTFCLSLVAALLTVSPAEAAYPDRPVRVIVAFAPGGAVDVVARIASQKLSE